MESRQRSGLYGSGDVPRSRMLTSRAVGPKSAGLRDLRDLRPIRRVRPTRFKTKTIAAVAIGPIAATLAIVVTMLLGISMVPVNSLDPQAHIKQGIPPPPYTLVGYTLDNTGARLGDVTVNITNLRTGNATEVVSDAATDPGFFWLDLNLISGGQWPLPNDQIRIIGVFEGLLTGTNQTAVPDPQGAYMWENVSLITVIPEFGDLALPIVGMLGMFAMVAVVARSKKHE